MEIIESYKRKARESVANALNSMHDEEEEGFQTGTEQSAPLRKQLIQEINPSEPTVETDYEAQQFQFYSKIVTTKPTKCVVCKKTSPKYTCPKCKVRYCSSDHYKTHNLFCTERFYKGQVEALMKRTKAAAGQKKKMVEFLKVHGEEMAQSEGQVMSQSKVQEISEKRLEEIMNALQEGSQVELSDNEMRCFQRYLKEIEECSLQQSPPPKNEKSQDQAEGQGKLFEEYTPFWQVQQGLQQYFLIDQPIPIETFNKSQHKSLLQYRQQASSLLREDLATLSKSISFKKTSIFVAYDVVQMAYLISLLFRAFNGEYLTNPDFPQVFLGLYQEDLSRTIAENQPNSVSGLGASSFPQVLPLLKTKMVDLGSDLLGVLKGWLPFVADDATKVLKNKYAFMEAVYRMTQMYRSRTNLSKKQMNSQTKMVKKFEFLLVFASQILYASSSQSLPHQFIETNVSKLVDDILQRDKQSEQSHAKAVEIIREAETSQKQKKIQQFLIV